MGLAERLDEFAIEFRREGEARIVLGQLETKFGALPSEVSSRVRSAQPEQLEEWSRRLLSAESLDALFASAT
jgi:hypothetical protein